MCERSGGRSRGRGRSEQSGASERVSGVSERVKGLVVTSVFLVDPDPSATAAAAPKEEEGGE